MQEKFTQSLPQQDTTIDNKSISKTFWRYAIPSVAAMLVNGLYQVIDGIFVGHFIGFEGLAGINMAWPIIGLIAGLGLLVGMGTGSLISIYKGEDNHTKAQQALATGLGLIAIAGLLVMAALALIAPSLLIAQGATGAPLAMGRAYIDVFTWGAVFTIAAGALPMLIRNDDSPNFSTALMMAGAIVNIILDYIFIAQLDMGLRGAAIATIIAQISITIVAVGYFFTGYSKLRLSLGTFKFNAGIAANAVSLGTSSLFMYVYFSFIIAVHNKLFMHYGSAVHVGAFAIVGYLMTMYYLLAEGIASGMQPPVSYYYGAGHGRKIRATLLLASKVVMLTGITSVLFLNLFPNALVSLFSNGDPALATETVNGLRLHLFAMFLDGLIALASVYFMSVNQGAKALGISAGNMLVQLPFLYLLPQWLGVDGVWLSVPLSNILLAAIVIPLVWKDIQKKQHSDITVGAVTA
ncbi:multidrug efflux protein [Photobacterium gaetbulicola]|uniref:Multidrug export protein MepA n=1 Tax=Photobacterium gaetbulicola Gung47 TaxID=658445 RepID=A0A0C5WH13_9GAMM|nr:MATE family efflux transporter [Photobacterium gaetbulicola]AJR05477.1 multidrug efflux pump VmrA [Photobacterium gaetbulicola Gung47]PSU12793.1 multidrug efflux protein [Photobacterium gaetbulicola]